MEDAGQQSEGTKSNLDLLLGHLPKDSLACQLVTACRGLDPSATLAAVKAILEARVTETRNALQNATDQLD